MQGQIESASKSKSGKALNVKIGGQFFVSKNWELENMVGQTITFIPSPSKDGSIYFINDYNVDGTSTTPAGQAFDQAHAQAPPMGSPVPPQTAAVQPPPPPPQRPAVDRDASITALALTKCIQGISSTDMAFAAYKDLYGKVLEWNPGEYDSDIPY